MEGRKDRGLKAIGGEWRGRGRMSLVGWRGRPPPKGGMGRAHVVSGRARFTSEEMIRDPSPPRDIVGPRDPEGQKLVSLVAERRIAE